MKNEVLRLIKGNIDIEKNIDDYSFSDDEVKRKEINFIVDGRDSIHFCNDINTLPSNADLWFQQDKDKTLFENIEKILTNLGKAHNLTNIEQTNQMNLGNGKTTTDYIATYNPIEQAQKDIKHHYLLQEQDKNFKDWTRDGIIFALKNDIPNDMRQDLLDKYSEEVENYVKEKSEILNNKISQYNKKVVFVDASEFHGDDSYEENMNEEDIAYQGIQMWKAFIQDSNKEEELSNTTTGRYADIEFVVKEIEENVNIFLQNITYEIQNEAKQH